VLVGTGETGFRGATDQNSCSDQCFRWLGCFAETQDWCGFGGGQALLKAPLGWGKGRKRNQVSFFWRRKGPWALGFGRMGPVWKVVLWCEQVAAKRGGGWGASARASGVVVAAAVGPHPLVPPLPSPPLRPGEGEVARSNGGDARRSWRGWVGGRRGWRGRARDDGVGSRAARRDAAPRGGGNSSEIGAAGPCPGWVSQGASTEFRDARSWDGPGWCPPWLT